MTLLYEGQAYFEIKNSSKYFGKRATGSLKNEEGGRAAQLLSHGIFFLTFDERTVNENKEGML